MLSQLGALVASPGFIDLILAGVVLEGGALLAYRRATGRGVAPGMLVANLVAGGSLMLAVRLCLTGGSALSWLPACLALALAGHLADLALRWQRRPSGIMHR
jgi:hypothetical protein